MMYRSEEIVLSRECDAVLIPSGDLTTLPAGLSVRITQSLGDTYTVITENGLLARIDATNADAIGKEPPPVVQNATVGQHVGHFGEVTSDMVWDQLRTCYDPEIPVNIVELGLIYAVEIADSDQGGKDVHVRMTLTAPGCGMGDVLRKDIDRKISKLPGVRTAEVEVVLEPAWSPDKMSEAARLELGMM